MGAAFHENHKFMAWLVFRLHKLFRVLQERDLLDEEEKGAVFGMFHVSNPNVPVLHLVIGQLTAEQLALFAKFCYEKVLRLSQHPDHISSAQSANRDEDKYPGAIRVGDYYLSLSGWAALKDEAFVIAMADCASLLRAQSCIGDLVEASDNVQYVTFGEAAAGMTRFQHAS